MGTQAQVVDDFDDFVNSEIASFDKFIDDANKQFISFLRNPWKEFDSKKPVEKRVKPEPVKPVVYDEKKDPDTTPVELTIEEILGQSTKESKQRPQGRVIDGGEKVTFDKPQKKVDNTNKRRQPVDTESEKPQPVVKSETPAPVPAPVPTLVKGERAEMGYIENPFSGRASVAITTSCKDVERAARLMDWAYGEEGHMYFNFGTEGESYTMVDGYPTYTDEILKNPKGLPVSQAMSAYIRGNYNGPFVQDVRYLEQYYTLDEQRQTPIVWGECNGAAHTMPPITPTSDESKEFSTIMNEINTYRDEMILKFIFGTESIDNFDTYVKNIDNMGLARALEIENAALDRYNSR